MAREEKKKDNWLKVLIGYTDGSGRRMGISVILSVISVVCGLVPYYCIYRGAYHVKKRADRDSRRGDRQCGPGK